MSARPRRRALLLAAGRGERLRPLSGEIPKPLLPVAGRPLAARTLDALVAAGCEAIAINLHHRGELIAAAFGDRWRGVPITYSREPELLGTLGALGPLRDFLGAADEIVIVNGDSLCRWPLRRLLARHRHGGAAATLLLSRTAPAGDFGGGVRVGGDGRVLAFRGGSLSSAAARAGRVFAGAHVLTPALLGRVPAGPADTVADLYEPLLAEGAPLQTVVTERPWFDLGTPRRYLEAVLAFALAPLPPGASFRGEGPPATAGARLDGCVVEAGARIAPGARLSACLLLPGCTVGERADLARVLVGPGVTVPAGARLREALLTAGPAGEPVVTPF